MKKLALMVMLATVAGSSMAQNSAIKKARSAFDESVATEEYKDEAGQKKIRTVIKWEKVAEAQELLTPAFTNEKTKDFAMAWDLQGDIYQRYMADELNKAAAQQPLDTMKFYNYTAQMLDAYYKAIEADNKGTYKLKNEDNMSKFRQNYIYCGQFFSQNNQPLNSHNAFAKWLNFPKDYPNLSGQFMDLSVGNIDPNMVAFYCALTAYQAKKYELMDPYREQALAYEKDSETAHQLYLFSTLERGDTAQWEQMSEDFAIKGCAGDGIAQNLLAHYFSKKATDKINAFADKLMASRPQEKYGPYAKGMLASDAENYEEAIKWYDKTLEVEPEFFDALFQAGTAYLNCAYKMNDALESKKMTVAEQKKALEPIKELCRKAEPYFLKIRELRPDEPLRWAPRLRQIYYVLEDEAKQKEIEPYCEALSND
ncbi:MAG: hypothetical protein HUK04_01800 [Bacteroidaceae bacterium]|nr:hypothetical protein [Bacteroidaceae bacterium]